MPDTLTPPGEIKMYLILFHPQKKKKKKKIYSMCKSPVEI